MKRFIAITSMLALSAGMLMAQDGATLFKKCAACHGANGEGKMGPSIKGKDVTDVLTNGGKKARTPLGLPDSPTTRSKLLQRT